MIQILWLLGCVALPLLAREYRVGFVMSRAIRELDATVPIVILSAHTQLELADAQQAIGFTEVFLKPIHPKRSYFCYNPGLCNRKKPMIDYV